MLFGQNYKRKTADIQGARSSTWSVHLVSLVFLCVSPHRFYSRLCRNRVKVNKTLWVFLSFAIYWDSFRAWSYINEYTTDITHFLFGKSRFSSKHLCQTNACLEGGVLIMAGGKLMEVCCNSGSLNTLCLFSIFARLKACLRHNHLRMSLQSFR